MIGSGVGIGQRRQRTAGMIKTLYKPGHFYGAMRLYYLTCESFTHVFLFPSPTLCIFDAHQTEGPGLVRIELVNL